MSAPTANNHPWFSAKKEVSGQQGVAYSAHQYNRPTHHSGPPTDQVHQSQQPQYKWYTPATKSPLNASHQMNSDAMSGGPWNYQQASQYGQQVQQNTQQYSAAFRDLNVPPVVRPNPDPWNWGLEESGISATSEPYSNNISVNNNACLDPSWGWSIENTATYQEHSVPSTNTSYSSGQHGQNYATVPLHPTLNTVPDAKIMTPSTADIISESFSPVSAGETALFHSNASQHLQGSFTVNYEKNDSKRHPAVNSVSQYPPVSTTSHFKQDNYSYGSRGAESDFGQGCMNNFNISQQQTYGVVASGERIMDSHVVTEELQNVGNVKRDSPQSSVDYFRRDEEFTNVSVSRSDVNDGRDAKEELDSSANDVPELSRDSSSREQDTSKQNSSTGNDGLSSQWSAESFPSSEELSHTIEGNEVVSSYLAKPESPLATDTLQVNQQNDQNHQSYGHSMYEFANSRHTERAEQIQCLKDVSNITSADESRNVCNKGYQSYCTGFDTVNQATREAATWEQGTGSGGCNQVDTKCNTKDHVSVGDNVSALSSNLYVHSDLYTKQPGSVVNVAHTSTETNKTALSVESVARAFDNLTVSSTENLRSLEVENKDIVCPETEENSRATLAPSGLSNPSYGSNVNLTTLLASSGPPKRIGIAQGKNSSSQLLNQKFADKYRASPPSVEGVGGIDKRNYSHPRIPSVGPTGPARQFGVLPDMSQTVNLMQATYSHRTVETPGNFVIRKKNTPPPLMTEDTVNLETVPDNKERPDFIDVPQATPSTRLHASPVGQDAVRGIASQWTQSSSYSTSPANQEVAPRCGPDRNQYLETGQLTGDERDIRSSMPDAVETLQSRVSRNGNSNVPIEGILPLLECHRMVPGQITEQDVSTNVYELENVVNISSANNLIEDVSTPPPGLHRMVPGQFTENENAMIQIADSIHSTENPSDNLLLHRMVPGQLTEESGGGSFVSEAESVGTVPPHSSVDDIPPPGLRRMVPGESSSPESQGNVGQTNMPTGTFEPIDALPLEPRVVTGVAQDEMDDVGSAGTLPLPASPLSAGSRLKSEPVSPTPEQTVNGSNIPQPPSERSETIGSDSVEAYPPPPPPENTVRDTSGCRRDNVTKDRERRHRDDEGNDHSSQHQRRHTDGRDYFSSRDKDQAESPGTSRYRDQEEWDWKYDARHERDRDRARDRDDSSNSGRYRDDRRYDSWKEYRSHDGNQRPRQNTSYDRHENDADTEDYLSDCDRENTRYRDNYDSRYRDRPDREREQRENMEKSSRQRHDHRTAGRDRNRDRDEDHDRGQNRDRERRRQDYSDRRDYRGSDEYYSRGYEVNPYYRDNQRSRPSSRTEYDEYRQRDYHGYGAYNYFGRQMDSYHYDPYYTYKYYENLRRTNPAAYAEWYAKYYSSHSNYNQGSFSEDRGSVHSGRSSANEELRKEQGLEQTDSSIIEDPTATTPQRLTPAKFSTAHVKGILTARGQVVKILPHYPLDGQPATVEIHDIRNLVGSDETLKEIQSFPGPLVRGVTHKNSVIAFCIRKLKKAERDPEVFDRESVMLLWKLLILLLRQNGTVVGADIAELLLSNSSSQETLNFNAATSHVRQASPATSQHSSIHDMQAEEPNTYPASYKSEEELTVEFREYLLYGNKKEALEWAMKRGLWGHALFLASKMDQRTYASVMMRFANGLAMNDPLQTLYQLMSGRQPAAVTCCADDKWGDWKPHLAMILSNPSQRPELDHKAVITLGDTLGARGYLHASHFCYLMAQLEFGVFSHKSSKIVLLGSSHLKPFLEFASNEAIQMTEVYIYACQLAEYEFNVPQFQAFKYLYAKRLAEFGMPAEAIHYVEVIAGSILQQPTRYSASFIKEVYELGNQLKYHDPLYSNGEGEVGELEDPSWLHGLHNVIHNYNIGMIQQDIPSYSSTSNLSYSEGDPVQHGTTNTDSMQDQLTAGIDWHQQQQLPPQPLCSLDQQTRQRPVQHGIEETGDDVCQTQAEPSGDPGRNFKNPDQYWTNSQWGTVSASTARDQDQMTSVGDDYSNSETLVAANTSMQQQNNYWNMSATNAEDMRCVTLPGSTSQMTLQEEPPTSQSEPSVGVKSPIKQKQKEQVSKPAGGTHSWLGGIWNRFSLRLSNQMKLPDDKNPSIVWDPDKKRWTDVNGDGGEVSGDLPLPPKTSELPIMAKSMSVSGGEGPASRSSGSNVFKLNGPGKGSKAKYLEVLEGTKTSNLAPDNYAPVIPPQASVKYLIPVPVESSDAPTDFLTPAASSTYEQTAEQSHGIAAYPAPMMFDPASFTQKAGVGTISNSLKRYPN